MASNPATPTRIHGPDVYPAHAGASAVFGAFAKAFEHHPALVVLALLLVLETSLFAWSFAEFFGSDSIFYLARKLDHPVDFLKNLAGSDDRGHYRHLTLALFSFLLYPIFELNPVPYHAVALGLHFVNTALAFLVFRRLLRRRLAVLAASFFFGLHAVNSFVSYSIAFLPDLTYVFFGLLAILGFLAHQEKRRLGVLALSACSFVLALLCKETAVVIPALLAVCALAGAGDGTVADRLRRSWKALAIFAAIALLHVALVYWLKGGRLFPDDPSDPYHASFTLSSVAAKAEYVWWGLGLPAGAGRLKGHPRAMALLARVAPEGVLPYLGEISNLFLDPKRLLRLLLMLPLAAAFAAGIAALWRREPMIIGGLIWFAVGLIPVVFLAVTTMRHNLYLPILGFAAIMGLTVEALFERARERAPRLTRVALIYFFAAYFVSTALAVQIHWTAGWPVIASRAAEGSLNDLMRLHPSLAPRTTLYFLDNGRDNLVWFFEGGNLFRIFYREPSLRCLFEQSGDRLPGDYASREDLLVFGYDGGRLYETTQALRQESRDVRSYRLLDHLDSSLVSFANSEPYHLRGFLNTPAESAVFRYRFARDGMWRSALVTLSGARVEFAIPTVEPGSRLRLGAAMVHDLGDGALGRVSFESGGRAHEIYRRFLDPARQPQHRRWFDETVDLDRFAGQRGTLIFECDPGPASDAAADWFAWSVLKIERR